MKEKLEKLKKLADAMYYAAFNLTTDASLLRKAMNEYHQFVIHKYCKEEPVSKEIGDYDHKAVMESLCPQLKEEPTIPDIVDEHFWKMLGEEPVSIWHDASENPKEEEHLMCVYKDNRYHIGKVYKDEFDRLLVSDNKNIIELCMFEKWAYIDDILNLSNVKLPKEIEP